MKHITSRRGLAQVYPHGLLRNWPGSSGPSSREGITCSLRGFSRDDPSKCDAEPLLGDGVWLKRVNLLEELRREMAMYRGRSFEESSRIVLIEGIRYIFDKYHEERTI